MALESHELNRGCSQPLRYKGGKLDKYKVKWLNPPLVGIISLTAGVTLEMEVYSWENHRTKDGIVRRNMFLYQRVSPIKG